MIFNKLKISMKFIFTIAGMLFAAAIVTTNITEFGILIYLLTGGSCGFIVGLVVEAIRKD